jgi:hypothetical protein
MLQAVVKANTFAAVVVVKNWASTAVFETIACRTVTGTYRPTSTTMEGVRRVGI